jgi:FtsZ-interacting cell division protein ZipA
METSSWIWIIIAIIVVLVIIGIWASVRSRNRRGVQAERQVREDREQAGKLRAKARDSGLDAREKQAAAALTAAEAEQAAVEAERLKIQADQQRAAADEDDARSKATLRQAAIIDPDSPSPETDRVGASDHTPAAQAVPAHHQDVGNTREEGPLTGDGAPNDQESGHGRSTDET